MESISLTYCAPEDPLWKKIFMQSIEFASGRGKLERKYRKLVDRQLPAHKMWSGMVQELDLLLSFNEERLNAIPESGPTILIANHPFGVVDGVVIGYLAAKRRKQFKFLVNSVLCLDETLNQFFLPVDFAETREAQQTNILTRKRALTCLEKGEILILFPSGGVATAPKFWQKARELAWKNFVVKLIRKSNATVVPIFFYGQNSRMFQLASSINLTMRLAFLLHEVNNKAGKEIRFEIGETLSPSVFLTHTNSSTMLEFLKEKVFSLEQC